MQKVFAYTIHQNKYGGLNPKMAEGFSAIFQQHAKSHALFDKQKKEFVEKTKQTIQQKWFKNEVLISSIQKQLSPKERESFVSFVKEAKAIDLEGWAFARSQNITKALHLNEENRQTLFEELYVNESEDEATLSTILGKEHYQAYQQFLENEKSEKELNKPTITRSVTVTMDEAEPDSR